MKPSQIEPGCALAFGFVGAPIISSLNIALAGAMFPPPSAFASDYLQLGLFVMLLTMPMGFVTTRMLEIWNSGQHGRARALGVEYGIFALVFWNWF